MRTSISRMLPICTLLIFMVSVQDCDRSAGNQPPNILLILADDMGWMDSSVDFGAGTGILSRHYNTSALQRLASEGMVFSNAYACAVCSPSRVSLLTGLNPVNHGVTQWTYLGGGQPSSDLDHARLLPASWNWNGMQPEQLDHAYSGPALPAYLKEKGYRTMQFGKGHLGASGTPGADPGVFGFDIRMGGRDAGGCGSYFGEENFGAIDNPEGPWRAWDMDAYFGTDIHLTEALTREALKSIREAVYDGVPFFCYMAHYAPHTPIQPDPRFSAHYLALGLDSTEAAYASLIKGVDKSTGDLLNLLNELDIARNTIVVFASDNGAVSHKYRSMSPPHTHNQPLSSGKGSHHEGGIRIPMIVRWPGLVAPGSKTDIPVALHDWFPTFLDILHDSSSVSMDGISLLPVLSNTGSFDKERPLFWHFPNFWGPLGGAPVKGPGMGPCSAIRRGKWKLIYYHEDQSYELFNLVDDPGETRNMSPHEPEMRSALSAELGTYLRERQAPMPIMRDNGNPVPYPGAAMINQ